MLIMLGACGQRLEVQAAPVVALWLVGGVALPSLFWKEGAAPNRWRRARFYLPCGAARSAPETKKKKGQARQGHARSQPERKHRGRLEQCPSQGHADPVRGVLVRRLGLGGDKGERGQSPVCGSKRAVISLTFVLWLQCSRTHYRC